jgi:hypothetical protein
MGSAGEMWKAIFRNQKLGYQDLSDFLDRSDQCNKYDNYSSHKGRN